MRVEHARIVSLTPGRRDPAWRYRLKVSPRAVYRTECRRCDLAYAMETVHVPYPAAVQRLVERGEPLAFAEPVPETGALPGFDYRAREAPCLRLDEPHPSMTAIK